MVFWAVWGALTLGFEVEMASDKLCSHWQGGQQEAGLWDKSRSLSSLPISWRKTLRVRVRRGQPAPSWAASYPPEPSQGLQVSWWVGDPGGRAGQGLAPGYMLALPSGGGAQGFTTLSSFPAFSPHSGLQGVSYPAFACPQPRTVPSVPAGIGSTYFLQGPELAGA